MSTPVQKNMTPVNVRLTAQPPVQLPTDFFEPQVPTQMAPTASYGSNSWYDEQDEEPLLTHDHEERAADEAEPADDEDEDEYEAEDEAEPEEQVDAAADEPEDEEQDEPEDEEQDDAAADEPEDEEQGDAAADGVMMRMAEAVQIAASAQPRTAEAKRRAEEMLPKMAKAIGVEDPQNKGEVATAIMEFVDNLLGSKTFTCLPQEFIFLHGVFRGDSDGEAKVSYRALVSAVAKQSKLLRERADMIEKQEEVLKKQTAYIEEQQEALRRYGARIAELQAVLPSPPAPVSERKAPERVETPAPARMETPAPAPERKVASAPARMETPAPARMETPAPARRVRRVRNVAAVANAETKSVLAERAATLKNASRPAPPSQYKATLLPEPSPPCAVSSDELYNRHLAAAMVASERDMRPPPAAYTPQPNASLTTVPDFSHCKTSDACRAYYASLPPSVQDKYIREFAAAQIRTRKIELGI